MDVTEQALHDLLLENKPDGADHDPLQCAFCTEAASVNEEENVAEQAIFTEEQHQALLASAIEEATTAAVATADAEILTLNEQLDTAKVQLEEKGTKIEELETNISDRDETARLDKLSGERVASVKKVANFTDEQVEERKESWAKMSEEDFEAYLGDIQVVAKAAVEKKTDGKPKTDFDGTRATAGDDGTETSALSEFFGSAADVAATS